MITNSLLKKLAQSIVDSGSVDSTGKKFILSKLSRAEWKTFLFYLRELMRRNSVTIVSADMLSPEHMKKIKSLYKTKKIEFKVDEKIIGGLIIRNNDDIYEASFKNMVDQTIYKLETE